MKDTHMHEDSMHEDRVFYSLYLVLIVPSWSVRSLVTLSHTDEVACLDHEHHHLQKRV